MAGTQNGFSIPTNGKITGTSKSLNGFSVPLFDFIDNTAKSSMGFSIPIRQYCLRVVDQFSNAIEGAIVTISEGLPTEQYISDLNGFVYVFIKKGTATAQRAGFDDVELIYDFEGIEDDCIDIQLISISGLAVQLESTTLPSIKSVLRNDFCYCAVECEYVEYAFASVGGEEYKNDKASFLFQKVVQSDSVLFELYKDGVKVADLNNDTYGTYYDGFAVKPLYQGLVLEWEKVLPVFGPGLYQVKTVRTLLGNTDIVDSVLYRLYPYTDELADKTVRIVGYQTANIKQSAFNFNGLLPTGWAFYIRVFGDFKKVAPEEIEDNYPDSQENRLQIQDQLISQYQLIVKQAPASIINLFLDGNISLSGRILVTDYNIMNTEIFRKVELYRKKMEYVPIFGQRLQDITVNFSERNEGKITQNF